jgi:putative membrane protein
MKIRTKDFFSTQQKETIRQAVQSAESSTRGEIVVVAVDESDPYRDAELMGALFFAAGVSLALSLILHYATIWFFVPVTAILVFPFIFLFRLQPHMKLAFLSKRRMEQAVKERAGSAFFQRGVYKTVEHTGILIFLSLLERKVWILGDEGIHGKTKGEFWRSAVRELIDGIKNNQASEALCSVIEKCGKELTVHFPGRAGDKNELCDDVTCD